MCLWGNAFLIDEAHHELGIFRFDSVIQRTGACQPLPEVGRREIAFQNGENGVDCFITAAANCPGDWIDAGWFSDDIDAVVEEESYDVGAPAICGAAEGGVFCGAVEVKARCCEMPHCTERAVFCRPFA